MLSKLRHAVTPGNDPAMPSSSMGSDFVTLDGNDNETAAEVLAPYLERHGVRVVRRNGQNISARRGSSKIILSPKVSGDGIDRIVVSKFYGVKDQHRHSPEVEALARALNADLNVGTFSIDGDGDLLYQSHITFVERVEFAEIDAFLEFMDQSMMMAAVTRVDGRPVVNRYRGVQNVAAVR